MERSASWMEVAAMKMKESTELNENQDVQAESTHGPGQGAHHHTQLKCHNSRHAEQPPKSRGSDRSPATVQKTGTLHSTGQRTNALLLNPDSTPCQTHTQIKDEKQAFGPASTLKVCHPSALQKMYLSKEKSNKVKNKSEEKDTRKSSNQIKH